MLAPLAGCDALALGLRTDSKRSVVVNGMGILLFAISKNFCLPLVLIICYICLTGVFLAATKSRNSTSCRG